MSTLKSSLGSLLAEHGVAKVNDTLHEIMMEDYVYLKAFFNKKSPVTAPTATSAPPPNAVVVDVSGARVIKIKSKKHN